MTRRASSLADFLFPPYTVGPSPDMAADVCVYANNTGQYDVTTSSLQGGAGVYLVFDAVLDDPLDIDNV